MDKLTIFGGHGFIGSRYVQQFSNCIVNDKFNYTPESDHILYFISTVDNYNVFSNPHLDIDTNLNVLMTVLDRTRTTRNVTDVVFNFISSWFVYGDTQLPAKEDSVCNPKGFYSITKRTAEQLLISYCQTFGMKYRILRLANVIGPGDTKTSKRKNALQYIIDKLKVNDTIDLYDGGNFIRDYIYIDDCVNAINLIVTHGELNTIYNVGNGIPVRFDTLIGAAQRMLNSESLIIAVEPPPFHKIVQVQSMYMDTTKLQTLGYVANYPIETVIRKLL